jgi:hypothetical protein
VTSAEIFRRAGFELQGCSALHQQLHDLSLGAAVFGLMACRTSTSSSSPVKTVTVAPGRVPCVATKAQDEHDDAAGDLDRHHDRHPATGQAKQLSAWLGHCYGMIPTSDECRRKAKEADAMADTARDLAAREILREVAKLWRKLADQVEKRGW